MLDQYSDSLEMANRKRGFCRTAEGHPGAEENSIVRYIDEDGCDEHHASDCETQQGRSVSLAQAGQAVDYKHAGGYENVVQA